MTNPAPDKNPLDERLAYEAARQVELRGQLKRQQRRRRQALTILAVALILFLFTLISFYLLNYLNG